ncbi:S1 family peptidase [Micromonospora sp. NPDC050397]|uniref:S1 family peptidase n=1 Tax=Micromonospora sp. NPDC050397 TaxID=3364279 RepID=UPI003850A909
MRHNRSVWRIGPPLVLALTAATLTAAPAQAVVGTPAPDNTYRFVVKLLVGDPHGPSSRGCSGALVAPQWVITAKSCFGGSAVVAGPPPQATTATVGKTNLATSPGQTVSVQRLVPHPDRDVVLARLTTAVNDVDPIRFETYAPRHGQVLRVAGYGRTATEWVPNQLQTATFTSKSSFDGATVEIDGREPANASICKGDAGGPAFRERNGVAELVAVNSTSWQNGCLVETETRKGAVEARVDDLADWIRSNVIEMPFHDGQLYREAPGAIAVIAGGSAAWFVSMEELQAMGYGTNWTDAPAGVFGLLPRTPRDGTVIVDRQGSVYLTAGGAKIWFGSPSEITETGHGGKPIIPLPAHYVDGLASTPRDGTVFSNPGGSIYLFVGGAKIWFGSPAEIVETGHSGKPLTNLPTRYVQDVTSIPRDGTLVSDPQGNVYVVVGGAKIYFASWDEIVANGYADAPLTVIPTRHLNGMSTVPADGTLVRDPNNSVYVFAGGAKIWFNSTEEINQAGYGGKSRTVMPTRHLGGVPDVPRDGTLIRADDGSVHVLAGGGSFSFASVAELSEAGYANNRVTAVPTRYLSTLVGPRDGTLVRSANSPQMWRLSGGTRTAVTLQAGETFTVIGTAALNRIPVA